MLKFQKCNPRTIILSLLLIVLGCETNILADSPPLWGNLQPGSYAVGFRTIEQYDHSRTFRPKYDYFGTPIPGERARPIQMCLWYPAVKAAEAQEMVLGEYIFPSPEDASFYEFVTGLQRREIGVLHFLLGNNRGLVLDIMNINMGAVRNASPAEGVFPLIVYFTQLGSSYCYNLVLCEYLASHGFVVATTHSVGTAALNPQADQASLETVIRDHEFTVAHMSELAYVDKDKLGVIGLGFGGLASLIMQMRNSDVETVIELDGWDILVDHIGLARENPYFNPARVNVPLLHMYHGIDSLYDPALVDSCKYADRYLARFAGMPEGGFSSYRAVRAIISDSGDIAEGVSRPHYETCCRYVQNFLNAHLNKDEASLEFISHTPADNGVDPKMLTVAHLPGQKPPPTPDQFVAIIRELGVSEAIEIYERFRVSDPGCITFREATINALGYQFLQRGRGEDAVQLFSLNAEAYPQSANCWDSYADGCLAVGDNEGAIRCYKKVLEVLPADSAADEQLKEILRNNAQQALERLDN